ncbi:hypothetical protein C0Q70_07941 [Pomacea canaliculata]|uniref:Uncharacterized protein n=2 Tax=Pomacea canaliculata TaxID=400727 RepID=A0A2T7PGF0_POMCA|nr:hypothetical protein C0Q70_07941 [Pomacea canaliculata]
MTSPGLPSTASFPPIVEKVEEEERAAQETARCPPSPLAHYYTSLTLCDRYAWPAFLGDWAFVDGSGQPRRVSTGCLDDGRDEEADGSTGGFQRKSDDKLYAKDDLAVGVTSYLNQPLCRDALGVGMGLRHDGTRGRRVSVCRDIEFHFSVQPAVDSPTNCHIARCERPRDLPLSLALESATNSLMTSHSSVAVDWEVVRRRNSYVHVSGQDWIFFICLLVFLFSQFGYCSP